MLPAQKPWKPHKPPLTKSTQIHPETRYQAKSPTLANAFSVVQAGSNSKSKKADTGSHGYTYLFDIFIQKVGCPFSLEVSIGLLVLDFSWNLHIDSTVVHHVHRPLHYRNLIG